MTDDERKLLETVLAKLNEMTEHLDRLEAAITDHLELADKYIPKFEVKPDAGA